MNNDSRNDLMDENLRLRTEVERLKRRLVEGAADRATLVEENKRCHELIELAADAVFMGDPEGNIIDANQSATTLSGYPRRELLGKNLGEFFSAEERERTPLRYDQLKAGKVIQNERQLTRKDGGSVEVWMNSRMMPDGTYHTFMRDNSERKMLEERLRTLVSDLEAFSYTVSHDLKTPLSAILGCLEMLKNSHQASRKVPFHDLLGLMEVSAEGMLALIENLLTLARSGKADRPAEAVDTDELLAAVIADLGPHLEGAEMEVDAGSLPRLYLPGVLAGQIFHNLIGNSLLYAPEPGGTINVSAMRFGNRVRLSVSDRGPGIPEDERERIFDMHYRGGQTCGRSGTGLGLAIVARIAHTYGGHAWVEENPGGGSRFCVELVNTPPVG